MVWYNVGKPIKGNTMDATDRDRELIADFKDALLGRDWAQMADVIYIAECRMNEDEGEDDDE
jgi:hypothetical protein